MNNSAISHTDHAQVLLQDLATSFAALQQSVEELSQNMQALLQAAQEMLQNVQAFLETSHTNVMVQDAGNAAPHAGVAAGKRRDGGSARRGGRAIHWHVDDEGGEETVTDSEVS